MFIKPSLIHKYASYIDWVILFLMPLSGFLHPATYLYFQSFFILFLVLNAIVIGGGSLVYLFSNQFGLRIQGVRKKAAPIKDEIFETEKALIIGSSLGAWPLGLYYAGIPTGFVWTLDEMELNGWLVVLQMWAGIIVIDAYTYWKHRLLHQPLFYAFHKHHHTFKDPTPFSGFAVGPVEALLTFWPVVLICFPEAKHFVPLYITAIVGFIILNLYLHCGVTFKFLEFLLPKLWLNSSAWHNIHHSDTIANFGEVSFIWDKICKTSRADIKKRGEL